MPEGEDTDNNDVDTDVASVFTRVENVTVDDSHEDLINWSSPDVEGLIGDASVLPQPMPEPDHDDIPSEDEDAYTGDGVVAPVDEYLDDSFV